MEKIFETPDQFAEFLAQNETLTGAFPFLNEIINLTKNINVGCGCQKSRRVSMRNQTYRHLIMTMIGGSEHCGNYFKNYLQASKIIFKLDGAIIKEI